MRLLPFVSPKEAYILNEEKKLRSIFLSDIPFQANCKGACDYGRVNPNKELEKARKKVKKTEKFFNSMKFWPIPKGCPEGFWEKFALSKFIIDDPTFAFRHLRIIHGDKVIISDYNLSGIYNTDFQLLEIDPGPVPVGKGVPIKLEFIGKTSNVVYDGLRINSLPINLKIDKLKTSLKTGVMLI